jgi:large subunit ribosomal protein L15
MGRINPAQGPIGWEQLKAAGLFKNPREGVRILGRGDVSSKIDLHVAGITDKARKSIEAAGGSVTLIAR